MNFSSSMKKSFKSHGSYNHSRKISAGGGDDIHHEEQPILSDHEDKTVTVDLEDRQEVIVKIDGGDQLEPTASGRKIWRESSYEFWKDGDGGEDDDGEGFQFQRRREVVEDPPSKLIEQFLSKQREAGGDTLLDMDFEMDMDELNRNSCTRNSPPLPDSPIDKNPSDHRVSTSKEVKVSFQELSSNLVDIESEHLEKQCKESSDEDEHKKGTQCDGEVLRCTSFKRRPTMMRMKTRSRLIDQPEHPDPRSGRMGKSGQLRSGMIGKASGMVGKQTDEEEEDPLFDEDIPEEYKRANLSAVTLLQWVSLVFIVAGLSCALSIPRLKGQKLLGLQLWKWEVLVLVLICGRLVSGWGIRIVVFFVERNFLLRKRVLYFVYGVRKVIFL